MNTDNKQRLGELALVFIVEDDADIAGLISYTLRQADFAVRLFTRAGSVLEAALDQVPALIVLDGVLPDLDGLELLKRLECNKQTRSIRKLVLSARTTEEDKVSALESGADDYLTKPFLPRELVARVRAVLRSQSHALDLHRVLQVGNLSADLDARRFWVAEEEISLTTIEFHLMIHFMRHPASVFSRTELMSEVWPHEKSTKGHRIVDVYIRRLRSKIEIDPSSPNMLVTCRGDGYSLLAGEE